MLAKRDDENLQRLLRVAKATVEERQRHLANLQTAYEAASASLNDLQDKIKSEERAFGQDDDAWAVVQSFLSGAAEKKRALSSTAALLSEEIDGAREALIDARAEQQKFEHLLRINKRAADRQAVQRMREEAGQARAV